MIDPLVTVTLRDALTGEIRTSADRFPDATAFWWAEGNGSCDCNRELVFGRDSDSGICLGATRYRVVAAEPMPPGMILADFDASYAPLPPEVATAGS